jgi:MinD-like ATPase involved in chromosome partitioning or flagellar assembly
MIITCWSVKGGSGTTVVATSLALLLASQSVDTALLDFAGDVPTVLGLPDQCARGIGDWCSEPFADATDFAGLEQPVSRHLHMVPAGDRAVLDADRLFPVLRDVYRDRTAIIDAGTLSAHGSTEVIAQSDRSLLVLRPCYLSLRRATLAPVRPTGVVLIAEPGRVLNRKDVVAALGVPVVAEIAVHPMIARAVDAGLLASSLPRGLRALRAVA